MSITATTYLKLKFGTYKTSYHKSRCGECISFSMGDLRRKIPIVRIHSSCLFGESFFSLHCDCGQQLEETFKLIKKHRSGVIIYTYAEGRGVGLENKIRAMEIQRKDNIDTVQAFIKMGSKVDLRNYKCEVNALKDLKINKKIIVASNNPDKINQLKKGGFEIMKIVKFRIELNKYNKGELMVKKNKLGYYID